MNTTRLGVFHERKSRGKKRTHLIPILIQTQRTAGVLDKQMQQPHLVGLNLRHLPQHRVGDEIGPTGAGGKCELLLRPHCRCGGWCVEVCFVLVVMVMVLMVVTWAVSWRGEEEVEGEGPEEMEETGEEGDEEEQEDEEGCESCGGGVVGDGGRCGCWFWGCWPFQRHHELFGGQEGQARAPTSWLLAFGVVLELRLWGSEN